MLKIYVTLDHLLYYSLQQSLRGFLDHWFYV